MTHREAAIFWDPGITKAATRRASSKWYALGWGVCFAVPEYKSLLKTPRVKGERALIYWMRKQRGGEHAGLGGEVKGGQ